MPNSKSDKASGPSGVVSEMLKAAGESGVQWVTTSSNGVIREGKIPADLRKSWLVNVYKGKGDALTCDSYRGIKLLKQVMKILEKVLKKRIRGRKVTLDEMQFGFRLLAEEGFDLKISASYDNAGEVSGGEKEVMTDFCGPRKKLSIKDFEKAFGVHQGIILSPTFIFVPLPWRYVECLEVERRSAVRCLVRYVWGKFNELMPILITSRGYLLKGEGEDLQILCAECDDLWH